MSPTRDTTRQARRLTARSVLASTLLGVTPPRLSTRVLVRSGELFGVTESATRTALSRMVAAGEVAPDGDGYRLAGPLVDRHTRQDRSRRGDTGPWDGTWVLIVVESGRRSASDRAVFRVAAGRARLAELRDGVWCRPDNLGDAFPPPGEPALADPHRWFRGAMPIGAGDQQVLATRLWNLDGWAATARDLTARLDALAPRLAAEDLGALPGAFVASADALRHLGGDPLLPAELCPPGWPGPLLRAAHRSFDDAFGVTWRRWHRGVDGRYRAHRGSGQP